MKFTAIFVEAVTNSVTANVLFADPETNEEEPSVLSFSRPIEPGFEDSNYYFEINDQSYGSYGGLELVQLSRNSLKVRLEADVVEKFQREDFKDVEVILEIEDDEYESVSGTLRRIFKGFDIFQEV